MTSLKKMRLLDEDRYEALLNGTAKLPVDNSGKSPRRVDTVLLSSDDGGEEDSQSSSQQEEKEEEVESKHPPGLPENSITKPKSKWAEQWQRNPHHTF